MASIGFTIQTDTSTTTSTTTPASGTNGEYILVASATAWPKLVECQTILNETNAVLQRGIGSTSAMSSIPTTTPGMNMPSGFEQFAPPTNTNAGIPGGLTGPAASMANSLLQNPDQLRTMLQNPAIRQMMASNPNIANNPMAQQSLEMMQNNPEMLEQAIRMMGDNPELRRSLVENA